MLVKITSKSVFQRGKLSIVRQIIFRGPTNIGIDINYELWLTGAFVFNIITIRFNK